MRSKIGRSRAVILALVLAMQLGCTVAKHQRIIHSGLLTSGLVQDAFLREWGIPSATYTATSETDAMRFGFAYGNGYFSKGKAVLEIWEYAGRGTSLAFSRGRLVSWRTPATPEGKPVP